MCWRPPRPTHPIDPAVYHQGWANNPEMVNGESYCGIERRSVPSRRAAVLRPLLVLRVEPARRGGPLRRLLRAEHPAHADQLRALRPQPEGPSWLPARHAGADGQRRARRLFGACPGTGQRRDLAHRALSSFTYAPDQAMAALRHFHDDLSERIWGRFGFCDAFSLEQDWYAETYTRHRSGPDRRDDREFSDGSALGPLHEYSGGPGGPRRK